MVLFFNPTPEMHQVALFVPSWDAR
ncbi:hypothetical protein LINPERHAP1_LOCUS20238 [Linum perenne]